MKVDIKNIGKRLGDFRKTLGISQKSLAEKTGIERTYLSRVENGMPPSFDFLIKILNTFDISIDWLLLGEGQAIYTNKKNLLNIVDHDYLLLINKINKLSVQKKNKYIPIFLNLLDD